MNKGFLRRMRRVTEEGEFKKNHDEVCNTPSSTMIAEQLLQQAYTFFSLSATPRPLT